jgi:hypothetical protein
MQSYCYGVPSMRSQSISNALYFDMVIWFRCFISESWSVMADHCYLGRIVHSFQAKTSEIRNYRVSPYLFPLTIPSTKGNMYLST